jgi:hypothetical protein
MPLSVLVVIPNRAPCPIRNLLCRRPLRKLLSRAASTLATLQFLQQRIQSSELCLPESTVGVEPFRGFPQRFSLQPPRTPLCILPARNQPRPLENFQVFRNSGLAHGKRLGQLQHRRLPLSQPRQDRAPGRIRQCSERSIQMLGNGHSITSRFHNAVVMYKAGFRLSSPALDVGSNFAGCPISRVLCEKWGSFIR